MDDLIAFITARLGEDEAAQRAELGPLPGLEGFTRELREVEAGRRILERHRDCVPWGGGPCEHAGTTGEPPCPDLRDLAVRWSEHPAYRPEWSPA